MNEYTIRPAVPADEHAILAVARDTEMFSERELDEFGGMIAGFFLAPETGQHWLVLEQEGVAGAAFFSPEPFAEDVWNLWFIGLHPGCRGRGGGAALVRAAAGTARGGGARLLLVETSSSAQFDRTRAFYPQCGFEEEARIRDYYADGAHKVVFRMAL